MAEHARDVCTFLEDFVPRERIPAANREANTGGIVLLGWFLGGASVEAVIPARFRSGTYSSASTSGASSFTVRAARPLSIHTLQCSDARPLRYSMPDVRLPPPRRLVPSLQRLVHPAHRPHRRVRPTHRSGATSPTATHGRTAAPRSSAAPQLRTSRTRRRAWSPLASSRRARAPRACAGRRERLSLDPGVSRAWDVHICRSRKLGQTRGTRSRCAWRGASARGRGRWCGRRTRICSTKRSRRHGQRGRRYGTSGSCV